jgi:hypothetical protein
MMTTSNPAAPTVPSRIRSSAAEARPALTEVGLGGWRPAAKELPDVGLSVLMCQAGDQDSIQVGCCHGAEDWSTVFGDAVAAPTHWQDLPEVPMEEEVAS